MSGATEEPDAGAAALIEALTTAVLAEEIGGFPRFLHEAGRRRVMVEAQVQIIRQLHDDLIADARRKKPRATPEQPTT